MNREQLAEFSNTLRERDRRIENLRRENASLLRRVNELELALAGPGDEPPSAIGIGWRSADDLDVARRRTDLPMPANATERFLQIGSVSGFHNDGWSEQTVTAVFLMKCPVKEVSVYVWVPSDSAPDGVNIQVLGNGATLASERVEGDTPWMIVAPLTAAEGDFVSLSLHADLSFQRPAPDVRQLSFVLKGVDFK